MLPLLHLIKWKGSSGGPVLSHSLLVDFQQIHVRNVLLFCFGLSLARQLFGDTINCLRDGLSIGQTFLDMNCLINGTFTNLTFGGVNRMVYQYYYQWVPVLLLLMAISFHLPCRTWYKHMGYYINELTTKVSDKEACERVVKLVTLSKGNRLFWKTLALECVYMAHLGLHIWLLNFIFQYSFSEYHWFPTAISNLFPIEGFCNYVYVSGGFQTAAKVKCLLPLNTVYRKVFWIVYVLLGNLIVLHALCFSYRIYQICKVGVKHINMWWCMQIAMSHAQTWYSKQLLQDLLRKDVMDESKYETMYPVQYAECGYDFPPPLPPRRVVGDPRLQSSDVAPESKNADLPY